SNCDHKRKGGKNRHGRLPSRLHTIPARSASASVIEIAGQKRRQCPGSDKFTASMLRPGRARTTTSACYENPCKTKLNISRRDPQSTAFARGETLAQSPGVVLLTAPACFSNSRTRRSIGDSGGCSIRHPREGLHTDLLWRAMQNR